VVASQIDAVCGNTAAWIGLADADDDGQFSWINGEPLDFTLWVIGEPLVGPDVATSVEGWFGLSDGTANCSVCMGYPTETAGVCEICPVVDF
jgi:hypothetical protein